MGVCLSPMFHRGGRGAIFTHAHHKKHKDCQAKQRERERDRVTERDRERVKTSGKENYKLQ